jgi:hypothetical protein
MNSKKKFSGDQAFAVCRYLAQSIGERVHGLESTITTKDYLCQRFSDFGLEKVHAEAFPVLTSRQEKAKIIAGKHSFEGLSFGLSGSTEEEGVTGSVVKYTSWSWNPTPDLLSSISDKIVLLYTRDFSQQVVQDLIQAGARGIVYITYHPGIPPHLPMGFLYSALKTGDFDLLPPVISVSYRDGAHLTSNAREITIQANVTGTAIVTELARIFADLNSRWTLRFIACGSEECALQGAHHYCQHHSPHLDATKLNLNFDVQGARIGNLALGVLGDKRLLTQISQSISDWNPEIRQGPTGGDNRVFAHYGIPAVHWWFGGGVNFLLNHTPHDRIGNISSRSLEFVGQISEILLNHLNQQRLLRFTIPKPQQEQNSQTLASISPTTKSV